MGLLAMGRRCLLPVNVSGLSLVPVPPAKRRPFNHIPLEEEKIKSLAFKVFIYRLVQVEMWRSSSRG
jgi:hypothetical protein